jgi:DNA-binding XRE family transcriptional regulator
MKPTKKIAKAIPIEEVYEKLSQEDKMKVAEFEAQYEALFALREAREKSGLTQSELATRSGVPQETISKIESGKRNVELNTLISLGNALGKKVRIEFI